MKLFLKPTVICRKAGVKMVGFFILCSSLILGLGACGTTDQKRLKESRNAFVGGDLVRAESELFSSEVFDESENRLVHFCRLSSIAFSQGLYEKAIFFLYKARDTSNSTRTETGFTWLFSGSYRGNPIEYSFLHYYLVMSYELLADSGKTPAWNTLEIKSKKGEVLLQAQSFPERVYSDREIADLRTKARAELLAWDTHLQNLRNTYPRQDYYKEDLLARTVASYVHGASSSNNERRTGELLARDALKILQKEFNRYPSASLQAPKIEELENQLQNFGQRKNKNPSAMFFVEAGIMDPYKVKRYHLGLTTIFGNIQDPGLRRSMEEIGMHVILNTAPEFGLVLFTGAMAGAAEGGDDEDGVHYFSEAVDRSLGFEIRFPTIGLPPADTHVNLTLTPTSAGKPPVELELPVLSPLQEIVGTEIRAREQKDMFPRALRVGTQYLSVLIPAIIAYKKASQEGDVFKKLAVLAGYYIAKKAIDSANAPDLRSWDFLPKLIAGALVNAPVGDYQAKVKVSNSQGTIERDLGIIKIGAPNQLMHYRRLGDVPILQSVKTKSSTLH